MQQGAFDDSRRFGDTLMHLFSVPPHKCQPIMPADVNVVARRAPIPLFGAGLVEAIADETLLALEDPFDRNRNGVSGRAAIVVDVATGERRVGRFGWKAQQATLLAFGADAYRNEMGITNDLFPKEFAFGVTTAEMEQCDLRPDPEDVRDPLTRRRGIDNFQSFMRFLAPVARGPVDEIVRDGERIFNGLGCAACHVPSLTTGPNANPLFHRRSVPLFSDLLLHDIGTGDGIQQASARPEEIRTPALWGLRLRRPLLHDGSAFTIEDAIQRHQREAELAQRGFVQIVTRRSPASAGVPPIALTFFRRVTIASCTGLVPSAPAEHFLYAGQTIFVRQYRHANSRYRVHTDVRFRAGRGTSASAQGRDQGSSRAGRHARPGNARHLFSELESNFRRAAE